VTKIIGRPAGMSQSDWMKLGDVLLESCRQTYAAWLKAKGRPAAAEADLHLNWFLEKFALWLVAMEQELGNDLSFQDAIDEAWVAARSEFDEDLEGMLDDERKP